MKDAFRDSGDIDPSMPLTMTKLLLFAQTAGDRRRAYGLCGGKSAAATSGEPGPGFSQQYQNGAITLEPLIWRRSMESNQ